MKTIISVFIVFFFLCFLSLPVYAASPPGGPPSGPPPCWPPPCTVPIDGGIGILITAGAALGGKKLYDLRKSNKR